MTVFFLKHLIAVMFLLPVAGLPGGLSPSEDLSGDQRQYCQKQNLVCLLLLSSQCFELGLD